MSIKVLHLIDSGGLYGAEKMLLALVAAQLRKGLYPTILSVGTLDIKEKPIEREAKRLGLPVKIWRMRPGLNLIGAFRIMRWARHEGFELFHSHGYKFNILLGLMPRYMRKLPFLITVHGYVYAKKFTKMHFYQLLDRKALTRADYVVLVGEKTRYQLGETLDSISNISVIHNGLNINEIWEASRKSLGADIYAFMKRHQPIVVAVGRCAVEKGFESLIKAVYKLRRSSPKAGLLLVGDGPLADDLEALARDLSLSDCVFMPGYCSTVPAILSLADVLVIPSLTEGLPITLIEAMALGTPVVASGVGEIPIVLGGGKGGIVLNQPSEDDIVAGIEKVVSGGAWLNNAVQWSANRVADGLTDEAMCKKYCEIYRGIVKVPVCLSQ